MVVVFFALAVFGLGYFVSSASRTRSALPTLVLLTFSLVVFVLFSISIYNFNVVADETGTVGGMGGRDTVLGLLSFGLGIASLVVHLRARRSDR
ncbi:hypothetical protein BH24ACT21_BH24ACT21_17730 [soil metagenome]|jgi:uncharacterized membrane protein YidH (DUF202 family)